MGTSEKNLTPVGKGRGKSFDEIFQKHAKANNLDWLLIKALAMAESGTYLDPNAVGKADERGLMQLKFSTAKDYLENLKKEDLFDPETNILIGTKHLARMIRQHGLDGGIQAYNIGEGSFGEGGESPEYLRNVLKYYQRLLKESVPLAAVAKNLKPVSPMDELGSPSIQETAIKEPKIEEQIVESPAFIPLHVGGKIGIRPPGFKEFINFERPR